MPDGTKYIVVDPNVLPWNWNTTYQPGDTFTGPDGKIYQVDLSIGVYKNEILE
jgi:hypothetical protein